MRIFSLFFSLFLLGFPLRVLGATFELESTENSVDIGRALRVDVELNPDGDILNTVAGSIRIPAERFDVADVSDGNSIISVWIEHPRLVDVHTISFAGIMPGGYGIPGHLFSFFIIPKSHGEGIVTLHELTALIHDGLGTPANVSSMPLTLMVTGQYATTSPPLARDTDPPEPFTPEVSQHPTLFDNQWFVSFTAQDKESGVDYYAVQEQRQNAIDESAWQKVASPHILADQDRHSYIFVKAVDKKGNERIALVSPTTAVWYTSRLIWSILLSIMLVGIWIFLRLRKKMRAR